MIDNRLKNINLKTNCKTQNKFDIQLLLTLSLNSIFTAYMVTILKAIIVIMMPTISQSSTKYGSLGFFLDVQKVMINVLTARKLNKCRVKSNSRLVGKVIWVVKFSREIYNVKNILNHKWFYLYNWRNKQQIQVIWIDAKYHQMAFLLVLVHLLEIVEE